MPSSPPVVPPVPPLPPGVEILRPNQDLSVRLWQPRPVFLQLNEALNPADPAADSASVSAPVEWEVFDDATGCPVATRRARFEVGLTDPAGSGPWQAIQLRFRAVRSRPPSPERIQLDPPDQPALAAPRVTPTPYVARPVETEHAGQWQSPPLENQLVDFVGSTSVTSYISAPVLSPPGDPARIGMSKAPVWGEGWNQIVVRVSVRARPARTMVAPRTITGLLATEISWTNTTVALPPPPPVIPPYTVRWKPLNSVGAARAFKVSGQQLKGNGVLSSDTTVDAVFSLASEIDDYLLTEVSLDDITYGGSVAFHIGAFESIVIYYRITILSGGTTPSGNLPVGVALEITGPAFSTPNEVIAWPSFSTPFKLTVSGDTTVLVPLETVSRLKVTPAGNENLESHPALYTGPLTTDWVLYTLVWDGYWSATEILDLHFDLAAMAIDLYDDAPFIDLNILEAVINPYCPGLDPPPLTVRPELSMVMVPDADLHVTGWSPTPVFSHLLSPVDRAAVNFVTADPRQENRFLVNFSDPGTIPPPAVGYTRNWIEIRADVQARFSTTGSTQAQLQVATDFGSSQVSAGMTVGTALYPFSWSYPGGMLVERLDRLVCSLAAVAFVVGSDGARVDILALDLRAFYVDVPDNTVLPPPPLPPSSVVLIDSSGEVFSCGSLGDCSGAVVGRRIARVSITNPPGAARPVMFVPDGSLHLRVFDTDTPSTEYTLNYSIPDGTTVNFSLFGWVGDSGNPYPLEAMTGRILVSLLLESSVEDKTISWKYIGF